jgi:putative modified peptide
MAGAISALCQPLPKSRGTTMADSKLSREHSLALLHKLATDDGFRSRYEQKAATALAELGVPQELIDSLPATSVAPMKLAPHKAFADAVEQLKRGQAEVYLCQLPPQIGLWPGATTKKIKVPFAAS